MRQLPVKTYSMQPFIELSKKHLGSTGWMHACLCVSLTLTVWACPSRTGFASFTWIWAQWKDPNTPTTSSRPSSSLQGNMRNNTIVFCSARFCLTNWSTGVLLPCRGAWSIPHTLPESAASTPVTNITYYDAFQTGQLHPLPIQLQLQWEHRGGGGGKSGWVIIITGFSSASTIFSPECHI